MYEPPNRGRKTWAALGRVSVDPGKNGNDPGSAITNPNVLANSFLMPRGYTMVWSGWDFSAGTSNANFNTTITLPIAKHADGSTISGPAFEYIVSPGASYALSYPALDPSDTTTAKLTHRIHLDDTPASVPTPEVTVPPLGSAACTGAPTCWIYSGGGTVFKLVSSTGTPQSFVANDIYEFSYTAKDPTVNGLGFAAIRDWNAWLRYETQDDSSPPTPNPLAGDITRIYTETSSQPARTLNDFTHLGFNQAENGKIVFDAMMQWIGAGDGINLNYRFSQPGRTERNRQDHLFAEGVFPFANVTTTDPFTGKVDSRYANCAASNTCPLAAEIYSANEYWVKAGSLLHTDPTGTVDLPDSPYARDYFISSHQHGVGNGASKGNCQQLQNPLDSQPIQRALFIALDEWSTKGIQPPPSRVPRFSDGTLVPPLPQAGMGFPNIPGVTYTGLKTTRYLFNYGPGYYDGGPAGGVASINPPMITPPYEDNSLNGSIYPSFIPKTDSDGNDIAGVRLPDVTVPLATYTGWALRLGVWANDGCESSGQYIPFAKTQADRTASGDPRPSIQERYPSFGEYTSAVRRAIDGLVKDRLMLCEDADDQQARLLAAGLAAGVPPPHGNLPPQSTVPQCLGKTR